MHVRIYLGNSVAVQYINHMGGRQTYLNNLTREIWQWCMKRNLWLSAYICHLPGKSNVEADKLSIILSNDMEWKLNVYIFEILQSRCGLFDVELFVSRLNWQVRKYVSYLPDQEAFAVDAFSISWGQFVNAYAFPPFSILSQVLQNVEEEGAKLTLITPIWATQPWFSKILQMYI